MGTKMFKLGSFEDEIYTSMKRSLISNQLENKYSLDKLSKAADYINTAAELLDDTGFKVEADMLTNVLKRLANEQGGDENAHSLTDEDIENLLGKKEDEIIIEPLEQEIAPPVKPGSVPLSGDWHTGEIFETPEVLEFQSIAAVAAKIAAKKKV